MKLIPGHYYTQKLISINWVFKFIRKEDYHIKGLFYSGLDNGNTGIIYGSIGNCKSIKSATLEEVKFLSKKVKRKFNISIYNRKENLKYIQLK